MSSQNGKTFGNRVEKKMSVVYHTLQSHLHSNIQQRNGSQMCGFVRQKWNVILLCGGRRRHRRGTHEPPSWLTKQTTVHKSFSIFLLLNFYLATSSSTLTTIPFPLRFLCERIYVVCERTKIDRHIQRMPVRLGSRSHCRSDVYVVGIDFSFCRMENASLWSFRCFFFLAYREWRIISLLFRQQISRRW